LTVAYFVDFFVALGIDFFTVFLVGIVQCAEKINHEDSCDAEMTGATDVPQR
jgi:hypothetical protein